MKKLITFLGASLLPVLSNAAEVGISGGFGSTADIRLPIKTENYVFEPYISHQVNLSESASEEYSNGNDYRTHGFGLGVWKILDVNEVMFAQYGLQVGYLDSSRENSYSHTDIEGIENGYVTYTESTGFELSPGFGLYYAPIEKINIGFEVKYRYSRLNGTRNVTESSYPDYEWVEREEERTKDRNFYLLTQAVVKFYF